MSTSQSLSVSLDIASVIQSSLSLSEEIVLSRLELRILKLVMANTGAERGLCLISHEERVNLVIKAIAEGREQRLLDTPMRPTADIMSFAVLNYVNHTHKSLVLNNAKVRMLWNDRHILE